MPLAEQSVIEQYSFLSKKRRARACKIYNSAKRTKNILQYTGIGLALLMYILHEVWKENDEVYQIAYQLFGTTMDNGVSAIAAAFVLGFWLLSWIVFELIHVFCKRKYPYYSKELGKYADKIDAIQTHRYK